MATYASDSDDEVIQRKSSNRIPKDLFSDDDSGDDRSRDGRISEAEEDNSLNRREGGPMATGKSGGGDKDTDDEDAEEQKKAERKKKEEERKKKKAKGPVRRLMISEEMLTGKNGISTLPDVFKDFTFNGKGHERRDLDRILSKMEYWIHLLHPKHPFDQCLERIEFLGSKRKVIKTHLKRIRMGMLQNFDGNDEVVNDQDDDDIMENIDTTELAESASAFVKATENAESVSQFANEVTPSSQQPSTSTKSNNVVTSNDNEFPDDDDEFFEVVDESALGNAKKSTVTVEEMDIDMEDVPDVDDDDEDDYLQKQMETQMKRAQEMESQLQHNQLSGDDRGSLEAATVLISTPVEIETSAENAVSQDPSSFAEHVKPVEDLSQIGDRDEQVNNEQKGNDVAAHSPSSTPKDDVTENINEDDDGINLDDLGDNDSD